MTKALKAAGAMAKIVAPHGGTVLGAKGTELTVDFSFLTTSSVLFDAVYVPGGGASVAALLKEADAVHFVNEAFKHCKTIAATGDGADLLSATYIGAEFKNEGGLSKPQPGADPGIIVSKSSDVRKAANDFIAAIAQHRHWDREMKGDVPA
jgi:catalase